MLFLRSSKHVRRGTGQQEGYEGQQPGGNLGLEQISQTLQPGAQNSKAPQANPMKPQGGSLPHNTRGNGQKWAARGKGGDGGSGDTYGGNAPEEVGPALAAEASLELLHLRRPASPCLLSRFLPSSSSSSPFLKQLALLAALSLQKGASSPTHALFPSVMSIPPRSAALPSSPGREAKAQTRYSPPPPTLQCGVKPARPSWSVMA